MDKCNYVVNTLATLICLIGFFANNFVILKQFVTGKTFIASSFKAEEPLLFPAIVMCNFSAYKELEIQKIDLDDYFRNTFKLSDALESITFYVNDLEVVLYNKTYRSESITIESIHTYYRGRCYKFHLKNKVITLFYNIWLQSNIICLIISYIYCIKQEKLFA